MERLSLRSFVVFSLLFSAVAWPGMAEAGRLRLTWTDRSHNENGFQIERKTGRSGAFALIAITAANVSSYTDSTVTPGITYCYRVRAFNRTGFSAYTAEVCRTPSNSSSSGVSFSSSGSKNSQANAIGVMPPPEAPPAPPSPPAPRLDVQLGVFRPATGLWYLDLNGNGLWDNCEEDACLGPFGQPGDLPVIGDWSGTGKSSIGVSAPLTGFWQLDRNDNGVWDGCQADLCFGPNGPAETPPLLGDWTGSGTVSVGIFDAHSGLWQLDRDANGTFDGCQVDRCLGPFGQAGDLPVVADWTGTGVTRIGVFDPRTGLWELDLNGNGVWDGCQDDGCFGPFGQAGDLPVVGRW
jgi:hypothetical protein